MAGLCAICGSLDEKLQTCAICGKAVCFRCFRNGVCRLCASGRT